MSLLTVQGLQTYVGQFHILQGVDLTVQEGACTVILGRNGAGKTTTLRSVMGLAAPSAGQVMLGGENLAGLPAWAIARKGVAYVPEDRGIFASLTVEENLWLALRDGGRAELSAGLERVLQLFPDLEQAFPRGAGTLSGGQKQMLAIGRGLMNQSRLILVDEPSKALAPVVVTSVAAALNRMKGETAVLLVEQNFSFAARVADDFVVIDAGRTVLRGRMADLVADPEAQRRYLGIAPREVPAG